VDVLSQRQLNRTLLARQLLLERQPAGVEDVLRRLVGMQAQEPRDPYVGLWSRVTGFEPAHLEGLLTSRQAVRIVLMRGTIHLVTGDDCCATRALFQPVLDYELTVHQEHKAALARFDMAPVLGMVRPLLAEAPRTQAELRAVIAERFPDAPAAAAAYAVRNLLPLVQVPPRGLWSASGQVRCTTADAWMGRPVDPAPSLDDLVLRYLAAFGPATPADVTAWSGLKGARPVIDRLRPHLRLFHDERGRELFDVEDGPFPDPDTPAPVRFLPEYDNVLLGHRDRSRIVPSGLRPLAGGRLGLGSVLVDGFLAGRWSSSVDPAHGTATVTVELARPLSKRATESVEAEGRRLARFRHAGAASFEARVVPVPDG
jgi:hypothetical protein